MQEPTVEKAAARSNVYRFLALGFQCPDARLVAQLEKEIGLVKASLDVLGNRDSLKKAKAIKSALETATLCELETSYIGCFGHAISKECPPYEAEYGQAHIFQKTQRLADVAGFYRAFGLEPAADHHDRHDHLSVELEFMQFLCLKEAYALDRDHSHERVTMCRHAQRKFLAEHLGAWAFGFGRRLREKARDTLYARLGEMLMSFLANDIRSFGLEPDETAEPKLAEPLEEETAACEECPLATAAGPLERGGPS